MGGGEGEMSNQLSQNPISNYFAQEPISAFFWGRIQSKEFFLLFDADLISSGRLIFFLYLLANQQ